MRLILVGLGCLAAAGVAFAAVRFRARIARALRRVRHGLAARRSVFIAVLAVAFAAAIALFLWKVPELRVAASREGLSAKDIIELENQTRATWAQVVAGAFALLLVYLTWRRIEVAQEGQLTERFTRAIEQLGSEKLEVRLGGIYALERIAKDSPKDHWTIMEVLTAFVRERARWRDQPESSPASEPPPLRTDIQAILTVIGRRTRIHGKGEALPLALDLSNTDLRGASLVGAHLEGANLQIAHLEWANLGGARLEGADLAVAHLEGAYLGGAHLEGAYLGDAHLKGAKLWGAHLKEADLGGAHLERADLDYAHLEGAILGDAHLEGADLRDAHLEGADLGGAHVEGANLGGAHLERAILIGAHLEGVDLRGVAGLTREQLAQAIIDEKTKLADYLRPADGQQPARGDE